ncbi:MAG TPA: pyridoxal-phosphate dependent enzyme, partial [Rhodanobacteraceae bacterium]|nr:pyridoxal-phosphate dependent enzyme [Rhodanobacteraceae bacterium]
MNEPLRYLSTRGRSPAVTISGAIAAGLAPDGGLYVPGTLPRLDASAFDPDGSLADTAATLLAPFFPGDPLATELPAICREALDFETPLRTLPQRDTFVLELFHGPTAAFKDVGARFLAACLRRLPRADARPLTILVATSGDTGAAVGAAFHHHQPKIEVVILYPDGRVSPRQAHQLGCFGGNVRALRVQGRFDDCQRMVKAALNDAALQSAHPLSSANSISLGRLLPQMSYYAHAALQWWRGHGTP